MKGNFPNIQIYFFFPGRAVKCYQCSSDQDEAGSDLCGAYAPFDVDQHIPIECLGEEAVTPGTFCVRIVKQGPRGFICKYIFNLSLDIFVTRVCQIK